MKHAASLEGVHSINSGCGSVACLKSFNVSHPPEVFSKYVFKKEKKGERTTRTRIVVLYRWEVLGVAAVVICFCRINPSPKILFMVTQDSSNSGTEETRQEQHIPT